MHNYTRAYMFKKINPHCCWPNASIKCWIFSIDQKKKDLCLECFWWWINLRRTCHLSTAVISLWILELADQHPKVVYSLVPGALWYSCLTKYCTLLCRCHHSTSLTTLTDILAKCFTLCITLPVVCCTVPGLNLCAHNQCVNCYSNTVIVVIICNEQMAQRVLHQRCFITNCFVLLLTASTWACKW